MHGAGGGAGVAAIGVAKALGAGRVVASTEAKREAALAAGADNALDATGDWVAEVRALTGGRGANVVWDPVGGEAFAGSLRCMAPEARPLVVGFASGQIAELAVNRLLLRHLDVVGVNFGGMLACDRAFAARTADELFAWVRSGALAPTVGAHLALEEGARALEDFAARRVVGTLVLRIR